MSFWLNDRGATVYFRQIPIHYKVFISVLIPIFFATSWFYCFYLPTQKNISKQNLKLTELKHVCAELETLSKALELEQGKNDKLCAKFESLTPSSLDSKNSSNYVLELLAKHELSCTGIQPLLSKVRPNYEKEYFCVTVKGSYAMLLKFWEELSQKGLKLKFGYSNIVRWKDDKVKAEFVFRHINFHKI